MNLQIIKSIQGKDEYVLLPVAIYNALHNEIAKKLQRLVTEEDYAPFEPADYVDNPIALARIKAHITREELANHMGVSQAYISKIERQEKVTPKVLLKVKAILKNINK
jgi:DNA-binding XRE family transcriptional regulator